MSLFSTADFPVVRAALDIALESTSLPDSVIAMDIYQGEAEEEVLERIDKEEAELDAEELAHAKKAAIYLTAALIAPNVTALPYFASNDQFTRVAVNWTEKAKMLRQRADEELQEIIDTSAQSTATMPTFFAVASGDRGR